MHVTVDKNVLVDAVNFAGQATAPNPPQPVYRSIKVEVTPDENGKGTITFTGHDPLSQLTNEAIVKDVTIDGEKRVALLPGPALRQVVASLPNGNVTLTFGDKTTDKVNISVGKSRFGLPVLAEGVWAKSTTKKVTVTGTVDAETFATAIGAAHKASASDHTGIAALTGIELARKDNRLSVSATDRFRLCSSAMNFTSTDENNTSVVVPAKEIDAATKTLAKTAKILTVEFGPGHVKLSGEGKTTTVGLIDGEFPKWERLFPEEMPTHVVVDSQALSEALARAGVAQGNNTNVAARLTLTPDAVTVSLDADLDFSDVVEATWDGEDTATLGVNPAYLRDGLNTIPGANVKIGFTSGEKPLLLTPEENEQSVRYLAMPVKLSNI